MFTAFIYTLRESLARRMGLVMLALSLIIPSFLIYGMGVEQGPNNETFITAGRDRVPAAMFAKFNWNLHLGAAQSLWMWIAIFTAGSLLSSYLQRGWADLLLTKGVARWQFLVARMAGCLTLYLMMVFLISGAPALYLSWRAGISAKPLLLALAVLGFNFLCLLSVMALVSVAQPNVALLVIVGFMQINFSNILVNRKEIAHFFSRPWLEPPMTFVYNLLPRTKEVNNIATDLLNQQAINSWGPFWWSAALALAFTVLACYAFHRKAI